MDGYDALSLVPLTGPLLISYFLSFGLYGVFVAQVYAYYICFPNDRLHIKTLVYTVLAIETAQSILVIRDSVLSFGLGFGQQEAVTTMHTSWLTMPVVSGIIGCIVQCFYAYRIKLLTRSKAAPIFICVLAVTQFAGAIVAGVEGRVINNILKLSTPLEFSAQVVRNVCSATCDLVIAIFISYHLISTRTKVIGTQTVLTGIIRLIVGSGILTTIMAILDLSLYLADYKRGAYFLVPCIGLGKLYSNSMMVLLNNRANILGGRGRDTFGEPIVNEFSLHLTENSTVGLTSGNGKMSDMGIH